MNRSHIMNVLSYENYCLKVKLQELLEKMARFQGDKIEKDENPPPTPLFEPEKEFEYKEMINKKDIEIEQLKEIVTSLTTKEQENQSPTEDSDEKIAQYEAALYTVQEQNRLLNEKTANNEIIIASYQEQHNLLHENAKKYEETIVEYQEQQNILRDTVKKYEDTIVEYQEQHNLLLENAKNYQQEMENKNNELIQLQNTLNDEREQFRTIIVGKDAEIAIYKR